MKQVICRGLRKACEVAVARLDDVSIKPDDDKQVTHHHVPIVVSCVRPCLSLPGVFTYAREIGPCPVTADQVRALSLWVHSYSNDC